MALPGAFHRLEQSKQGEGLETRGGKARSVRDVMMAGYWASHLSTHHGMLRRIGLWQAWQDIPHNIGNDQRIIQGPRQ